MVTTRPFHETIVEAIKRCHGPATGEIYHLMRLIMDTEIMANHDAIMAALDEYFNFPDAYKWERNILEVKESLFAQKRASELKVGDM